MTKKKKLKTEDTTSADIAVQDKPMGQIIRRYREFDVPEEVFNKFQRGRIRFERWARFLDLTDEVQRKICEFAKRNGKTVIVLRNSANGALRAIRRRAANE
jgi:hypothetical protein